MLDVSKLLEEIKASPYADEVIVAPHTGVITFAPIYEGKRARGVSGTWKEVAGTLLATIEREHNPKPINASQRGIITTIHREYEGKFVEAGTPLLVIQHYLSKTEVLSRILQQALFLFTAPERAKYYFAPEFDTKIKVAGTRAVTVHDGMELFIMSRMKREMPLAYKGPEGVIYEVYFKHNENVDACAPLIGVCPPENLKMIEEVVMRVQTEWEEKV